MVNKSNTRRKNNTTIATTEPSTTPASGRRKSTVTITGPDLVEQQQRERNAQQTAAVNRQRQFETDVANTIDQASSQYVGEDWALQQAVRNRWAGEEYKNFGPEDDTPEYMKIAVDNLRKTDEGKQIIASSRLSREERDKILNQYSQAVSGLQSGGDWDTQSRAYLNALYDTERYGGIEKLLKEQQEDAANDREYGRQLRGVDLDNMTKWERRKGTAGGVIKGAGEQIAAGGLGLVASGLNSSAQQADQEYGPALEQAARMLYWGMYDDPTGDFSAQIDNVRKAAAYIGGDDYANRLINKIRASANEARQNGTEIYMSNQLFEGLDKNEDALWENLQGTIKDTGIYDDIAKLQESSQKNIQYAKDVNPIQSKFGDSIVEAGVSAIQNTADAALAAVLGLSGGAAMIPFALRAYGGSYAEALQQSGQLGETIGKDVAKKAQKYGLETAAVEVGTEMMWGIVGSMSKVTRGGALDDYTLNKITDALSSLAKTERGAKALTWIAEKAVGGVTEGLEEVIGDYANWILNTAGIMTGDARQSLGEVFKESIHSFVTGALGGLMGEATNIVAQPLQQAQAGKMLKAGTLTTDNGQKITVDNILAMANLQGMRGTTLQQTADEILGVYGGRVRSADSLSNAELGRLFDAYQATMGKSDAAMTRILQAMDKVEAGERLSNGDVNRITQNQDAVDYLHNNAGMELDFAGNVESRRQAVETALKALASQNTGLYDAMMQNAAENTEEAQNAHDAALEAIMNRQAMPGEIADQYMADVFDQSARDALKERGVSDEAQAAIASTLTPGQDLNVAAEEAANIYKQARTGNEMSDEVLENDKISPMTASVAWDAARSEYTKELTNGGAEEVRLRQGLQGTDGESAGGQAQGVEQAPGSVELREGTAGFERSRQLSGVYSEFVSAADFGIPGGSTNKNMRVLTNSTNPHVLMAQKIIEAQGLKFVAFTGAAMEINGELVRGYYDPATQTVYVRADHRLFNADQIARHEAMHDKIRKSGNPKELLRNMRDEMIRRLGGAENFEKVMRNYMALYERTGLDYERVFEEAVCDAAGNMNEFVYSGHWNDARAAKGFYEAAREVGRQPIEVGEATQEEGRASNDFLPQTAAEEKSMYDPAAAENMYGIDPDGQKFSLDSLKYDIEEKKFQRDLQTVLKWTPTQVKQLVNSLERLIKIMEPDKDILDVDPGYNRDNRPYSPYKPNSDPLYKISLDYSTLCRKRLMTQYIIEKLQLQLHRPMTGEEQIAIRDMLKEYQEREKGLQVACAMCYVEAARLKSPDQMNRYFADPEPILKNYFAQKNKVYKRRVEDLQKKWKTDHGYKANDTKGAMTPADVAAFNEYSSQIRRAYDPENRKDQPDAKRGKEEQDAIARAKTLDVDNYLSAKNLAKLKESDPLIYTAYTSHIRAATRSKGLETDVPYFYGDSKRKGGPSKKFIEAVNKENGMRFSSWSDFQFTHLLDQIMATIDLSVRGAAMHGYTKFPEQVRIFGKTGAMFNMSGVSGGTGFNEDGSLYFSPTESIDVKEAIKLRDQFPDTAGLQCIGINEKHTRALLASAIIDYVIPYHVSGLNATLRKMAGISNWKDYTSVQEERVIDPKATWEEQDPATRCKDKSKWHKAPVFSEFFDKSWYKEYAGTGKGVEIMRMAARRYVQMCAERGMRPKFEEYLTGEGSENYWKLLIDRKMVNQKTGDLIQQRPVTPDFDFSVIEKEVGDYVKGVKESVKEGKTVEQRAFEYITDNLDQLPARIETLKREGAVEKNIAKAEKYKVKMKEAEHQANILGNGMYAAHPKLGAAYRASQDLDNEYMAAARAGDEETAARLVKQAAARAGFTVEGYHGTTEFGFTKIDTKYSDDNLSFFVTNDLQTARTYSTRDTVRRIGSNEDPDYSEWDAALEEAEDAVIDFATIGNRMAGIQGFFDIENLQHRLAETAQNGGDWADTVSESLYEVFDGEIESLWDQLSEDDEIDGMDYDEWVESDQMRPLQEAIENVVSAYVTYADLLSEGVYESAGNYHVYINPSNLLIIDAKGAKWNNIQFTPENMDNVSPRLWGARSNTRNIAKYANDQGFSGVLFKNVVDDGGRGGKRAGAADVYALFNPQEQVKSADPITYDEDGNIIPLSERFNPKNDDIRYSRELDPNILQKLNNEPTVTVYRAMQVIDGKLYPPMAAKVVDENGKNNLVEPTEFGVWYRADERPDLIKGGKFKLDKANGSSLYAAYNPYWHTSRSLLNDQFSSAYKRPNLVTVECEVPASELTSGYKADFAKDSVGEMLWHSGPVSSRLAKEGNPRRVILSRWVKVNRIVPDSEAAASIADMLKGTDIQIPANTVTPSLRRELEDIGVVVNDTDETRILFKRDPRTVTRQEVLDFFDMAPGLDTYSYYPVRINTPQILIDAANTVGVKLQNLPMLMQVDKALWAMEEPNANDIKRKAHGIDSITLLEIIESMNKPSKIYYQKDNGRFVEIIGNKNLEGNKAFVVIEKKENWKYSNYTNGFNDGYYNITVTVFPPTKSYLEKYEKDTERHIQIKGIGQVGSDSIMSSRMADIPFADSIADKSYSVKASRDLSTSDLYEANRQLRKDLSEMRQLLKTRTAQKDYWKGQTKVTEGRRLRQDDVNRLARELIKSGDSFAKAETIGTKLKDLGEYLLNTEDDFETLHDKGRMMAYEIAHDILDNSKALNTKGGEDFYQDFRDYLRNHAIYVAPSVREELAPDGWNDFRKDLFGTMTLTADKTKGQTVDKAYQDLRSQFGDWLLPEIGSEADQLNRILEVVETYRPVYENQNSYDMADAVEWTANEIMTRIIGDEIRETNPTYADRMEKKLAQQKAKTQAALKRVREQRDRKVANIKQHYQETAEKNRNRKAENAERERLLHIARRLSNMKLPRVQRALLDQYIGDLDLVSKSITGRTVRDLRALAARYMALKKEMGNDFIADPYIEGKLERLGKKQISDLTQEEVLDLTMVLQNIETMLRTEQKLINSKVKEDTYLAGERVIDDIRNSNGKTGFLNKYISTETATPEREVHRVTGYNEEDPLYQVTKELSDGQRKMLDYQMRAEALFKKWTLDKTFIRKIAGKNAELIKIQGLVNGKMQEAKITPAMRMSLYLHEKNDENMTHIATGGVRIPDWDLYRKGKLQEAYDKGERVVLSRGMVKEIVSHMTPQEKAFADAASAYFNGMSRDEINDVSEETKGYALANVPFYFPINTDDAFLNKEFDTIKNDGSIEGMGFTKERKPSASNPVRLYDMTDVLNRSIQQHSKYVGLAIPVRNMNKLYRVMSQGYGTSVVEALKQNWGADATKYIEKMMTDIQNGTVHGGDVWGSLLARTRSRYAQAVLTMNISVAAKQTASYPTAAAVVGWGPLIKAFKDIKKINLEKFAEYTPLLWYRSKGFSNMELGDIGKAGRHIPKILNWIQGMDVATTTKLVKAAMIYVNENNDLTAYSDEWYKEVARIYNRIIEETQPNYTMMQRPQILRSDSDFTRALQMFKTQPFQNFNILYDAFGNLAAKTRQYKANGSQENLNALKSARKNAARAVSSQIVSAFVFSLMQFAWDAFRGKTGKYDDDDDERTLLSWLKGMGLNILSSAGGMVPFGGYVLELGEVLTDAVLKAFKADPFFDQTFYGISENAAESFNDMGNALIKVAKNAAGALEGGEITEKTIRSLISSATDMAQFAGVPVGNIRKLAQTIARNAFLSFDGEYVGGYEALRVTTDPSTYSSDYYDLLFKAYQSNKTAYEDIKKRMLELDAFDEDKINNAMRKREKERFSSSAPFQKQLDELQSSSIWQQATPAQQKTATDNLTQIALQMVGLGNSTGESLQEKAEAGKSEGLSSTDYILYKLALQVVDQPAGESGHGSYNKAEKEEAYRMLTGKSGDNNPWR